jgi:hypothetical protein
MNTAMLTINRISKPVLVSVPPLEEPLLAAPFVAVVPVEEVLEDPLELLLVLLDDEPT